MIRPVDVLLDFLKAEQARGITHVPLDEAARQALNELHLRAKGASHAPSSVSPMPAVVAVDPPVKAEAAAAKVVITGGSRGEQLQALQNQAANWPPARQLNSLRNIMVFGSGSTESKVIFVSDAPTYHDERVGSPFAGPTGEKLDAIFKAMGLSRNEVYITHLVKFRPSAPRQTMNNRQSTPEEMAAFFPILRAEITIIRPSCIVAFGETAAQGLLEMDSSAPSLRGTWHDFHGVPMRVSLHPGQLLQTTVGNVIRRQLWEDMLEVMEQLKMPISEKQRGYFLKA